MFEIFKNLNNAKKRVRVGRGHSSGAGKTCTRGVKGQRSRSGIGGISKFIGGQNNLYTSLPKRGFKRHVRTKNIDIIVIALKRIDFFLRNKSPSSTVIDRNFCVMHNLIKKNFTGRIKLIGNYSFSQILTFNIDLFSEKCRQSLIESGHKIA